MPRVEIDEDIYQYLLTRVQVLGETASDILRRELGLEATVVHLRSHPSLDGVAEVVSHDNAASR